MLEAGMGSGAAAVVFDAEDRGFPDADADAAAAATGVFSPSKGRSMSVAW